MVQILKYELVIEVVLQSQITLERVEVQASRLVKDVSDCLCDKVRGPLPLSHKTVIQRQDGQLDDTRVKMKAGRIKIRGGEREKRLVGAPILVT